MARLGFMHMASEVTGVVYLTWLVDTKAASLLAPGVQLRDDAGLTPLTILSYRHGHFGPRRIGRMRRLLPSPLQSNWRLYLDTGPFVPDAGKHSVYFLKNIMDSLPYVAGTRLFSDIMQTHLADSFALTGDDGLWRIAIGAGQGSAPAFFCTAREAAENLLPDAFAARFGSWRDAVTALALQDRAIGWSDRQQRMVAAEIALPVAVDTVLPLQLIDCDCPMLAPLGAVGAPFAFLVPRVHFEVLSEGLL